MPNKPKILFISARLPFPAVEGHQIRAFGILNQLAKNYEIHLLSLLRQGEEVDNSNKLSVVCSSIRGVKIESGLISNIRSGCEALILRRPLVVTKYVTPSLKKAFLSLIEEVKPDIIHLDLLPLSGLMELIPNNIKVVLNEHNLESDLIKQKLQTLDSFFDKLIYQREYITLKKFEATSCQRANAVLACSNQDVIGLKAMGAENVYCIPNGVDAKRLLPDNDHKAPRTLVFLGGMGWYPNRLGIIWFLEKVFPLILQHDNDIQLQLIGNPEPLVDIPTLVKENVEVLGFVDDFIPYVQKSSLMIVPLNVGSGTRLKVVEGLALGKCMVSTTKGAEGVGLTHGKNVLFADSPDDFSNEIINALSDLDMVSAIEKNSRQLATEIYDWDVIGRKLFEIYKGISVN